MILSKNKMDTTDCPDILKKIVATKETEIKAMSKTVADFKSVIADIPGAMDFKIALNKSGLSIIAEIKKASPSADIIAEDFIPEDERNSFFEASLGRLKLLCC